MISRRTIAREWLIFLACFPFGFVTCFWLRFYVPHASELSQYQYSPREFFDWYYNIAFGLKNWGSLAYWLIPYGAVSVVRSIFWATRVLRQTSNSN